MIVVRKTTKTKNKVIVKTRFVSSFMLNKLIKLLIYLFPSIFFWLVIISKNGSVIAKFNNSENPESRIMNKSPMVCNLIFIERCFHNPKIMPGFLSFESDLAIVNFK